MWPIIAIRCLLPNLLVLQTATDLPLRTYISSSLNKKSLSEIASLSGRILTLILFRLHLPKDIAAVIPLSFSTFKHSSFNFVVMFEMYVNVASLSCNKYKFISSLVYVVRYKISLSRWLTIAGLFMIFFSRIYIAWQFFIFRT